MSRLPGVATCLAIAKQNSGWDSSNAGRKLSSYQTIDKAKGRTCDITRAQIRDIICDPCTYCGETEQERGLDRIDNSLGHCNGNVVSCCRLCNTARMDHLSHEEMIEIVGPAIRAVRLRRAVRKFFKASDN